jgi:ATP-binding cassette subfamily B protein
MSRFISRNKVLNTMNYTLNTNKEKSSVWAAVRKLLPLLKDDHKKLIIALIAIIINAGLTLLAPLLIGHAVNHFIVTKQFHGLLLYGMLVLGVYIAAFTAMYIQMKTMGGVGQRLLYSLRNNVF